MLPLSAKLSEPKLAVALLVSLYSSNFTLLLWPCLLMTSHLKPNPQNKGLYLLLSHISKSVSIACCCYCCSFVRASSSLMQRSSSLLYWHQAWSWCDEAALATATCYGHRHFVPWNLEKQRLQALVPQGVPFSILLQELNDYILERSSKQGHSSMWRCFRRPPAPAYGGTNDATTSAGSDNWKTEVACVQYQATLPKHQRCNHVTHLHDFQKVSSGLV